MAGDDPDTLLAYYLFVNHGWEPWRVPELSPRRKALVALFALKEIKSRPRPKEG
mgnify:CR=1 FL=1